MRYNRKFSIELAKLYESYISLREEDRNDGSIRPACFRVMENAKLILPKVRQLPDSVRRELDMDTGYLEGIIRSSD